MHHFAFARAGSRPGHGSERLATLLAAHEGEAPFRLAVGGPRASEAKGIYGKARVLLGQVVESLVG